MAEMFQKEIGTILDELDAGSLSTSEPTNSLSEYQKLIGNTGTSQSTGAYKSQDTFTGRVGKSFDEAQLNFFGGLKVYGDELNLDFLKDIANSGIETQKEDISKYKPSERSASFTKGIDEVSDLYNEEGLSSAIDRGALLAKDMVATALGSFGLTGAAVLAGAAAAPITGGASLLVAPFLVGAAQGTGGVYEEAKKIGASEENARDYAMAGGAVIGALDRIGAASVLSGLVKNFGKDQVKKVLAKDVGEEAAETALGQALKIGQTTAKGAAKGGVSEGITEGLQEQTQISFAGMSADEGLFPYKTDENINRLLDAVALGIAGGAPIRGVTENFAPKERYVPMKLAEEIKKENEKLLNSVNDADTEISKRASDTDTFQEGFIGAARKLVAKSTSPLINLAERSDLGSKLKNAFDTQPDVKAETTAKFINKYNNILKENDLIRSVKLPFQSPVSKKDNKELSKALFNESTYTSPDVRIDKAAKQIRNLLGQIDEEGITLTSQSLNDAIVNNKQTLNEISKAVQKGAITEEQANGIYYSAFNSVKENFNETLKGLGEPTPENVQTALAEVQSKNPQYKILQNAELKKPKYTGLFQELLDQGIDINFEADYLPVSYKLSTKAQRKLAKEVLIKAGMEPSSIDRFIENLKDTDYQSRPMVKDLSWEYDSEGRKTVAKREAFEESRTLPKKARDALFDAGLVEDNASAVLTSHFLNVGNRIGNQKITDAVNKLFTESPESVTKGEFKRIKDLHKAINGKWQIQDESLRKISNFSRAVGYISTMALSAFTALSEPFIIFSSLSPKHALPLTVKTLGIGFRRALRSILPKISKTEMEKNFENILQGLDGSLAERFNEIEGFTTSKKVTNTFFKLTLLTEVTQLSRYMAYSAMRNNLLDDAIRAQADNSLSKPTVDGNKAASRLQKIYGIANPKTNKTLTEWIESGGKDNPTLINRALSKAVDDNIMAPNTVNKPLLMSNPNYALIFQLKAFLTVFGNTVGFRIWRDITTPMYGGKAGGLPKNPEAAVKAALSLAMIMTVAAAAQAMKDEIRYGDEDSPFDDKEGGAMLLHLLMNTGIFGAATFLKDMIDASEYGSSPLAVLLGPVPAKISDLISGLASSNPRTVARSITSTVPLLGNIPIANSLRGDIVDSLEDTLVDVGYERKLSTGGRIGYRAEGRQVVQRADGGQVAGGKNVMLFNPEKSFIPVFDPDRSKGKGFRKGGAIYNLRKRSQTKKLAEGGSIKEPVKYKDEDGNWKTYTNEEMLQWDTVIGADTTTEGSGSALYDAATEGKLASYLSGEAKDAYNFLKDYDYSDLDIMDTLQKGGTAMLTGIADSIKLGIDASTKAVAGQEYNPNAVLEPVLGAGAGSAMFSAPKGALRVFGGLPINPNKEIPKSLKNSSGIKGAAGQSVDNLFSGDNNVVGFHGTVGDTMATTKFNTELLNKADQFLGEGLYITIDPNIAVEYANMRAFNKDLLGLPKSTEQLLDSRGKNDGSTYAKTISDNKIVTTTSIIKGKDVDGNYMARGQNVLPVNLSKLEKTYLVKNDKDRKWVLSNIDKLKKAGYDSVAFDNFSDRSKQIVVFPEHVYKVQKLSNEDIPLGGKKLTSKEEGFRKGGAIYNLRKRSQTKKLAEGGSIKEPESKDVANKPTNEEMLQWDTVIGADTTTEGSGSGAYDAATEGKLASYLSGEAKDAYNFLKNYDYSDIDIMDTLQKGGTAMLTGIADSIKSGVDASTKAVAGQEYNPNAVLEPVVGAGTGSAMFSAPKGALRVFGGKNATSMKGGEAPEWKKAESMIEEGKSPENIHKETGLYLASDNKLRYEIPDNKAQLNTEKVDDMLSWIKRGKPGRRTDVSNVLTHSDLYEEYPELRDIDLVLRPLREGEGAKGGHWDSYNNEIVAITDENGNIDKDYLLSTLIHELDHAAHSREGIDFNSGWSSLAANQVRRANKPLMDASGILYNSEQMMEAKDLPDLLSMISNSNSASLNSEPVQEAIKELLSKTIKSDKNRIGDFSKDNLVVNPERSYKSKNESETTYELKDGKGYITEFKYKDEDGNWNTYIGGEVNNPMGVETSYNGGTIRIGDMDLNSFDDLEKWNKDYYENVRLDLERALRNRPTDMLSSFLENKYYEADRIAGKFELMYHKNFGEVLARTSEDRANMTKAERSATFPENNMDVKRNDQLIGKNRTDFEESLTPEENKAWRKSMKTLQNQRVGMSKEKKGFKKGGAIYNLQKRVGKK
jgi:hypothetical protein